MIPYWTVIAARWVFGWVGRAIERDDEIHAEAVEIERRRGGSGPDIARTYERLRKERKERGSK